jgi:hypothetical protein
MDEPLLIVVTPEELFKLIVPTFGSAVMDVPLTVIPVFAVMSELFTAVIVSPFKVAEPVVAVIEMESPAINMELSRSMSPPAVKFIRPSESSSEV